MKPDEYSEDPSEEKERFRQEYEAAVKDGSINPEETTFSQYLHNCMQSQGGTLKEIPLRWRWRGVV